MGYEHFVATALKKYGLDVANKQTQAKGILKNWGRPPQDTPPENTKPEWFGYRVLRQLNNLSKVCSLEEAIPLVTSAVETRLSNPTLRSRSSHKTSLAPRTLSAVSGVAVWGSSLWRKWQSIRRMSK